MVKTRYFINPNKSSFYMTENLIEKAQEVFQKNFPQTTWFERAVFFSWACSIGDCTFCYMSTLPVEKRTRKARRSFESLMAETLIIKQQGWRYGFLSGGNGILSDDELERILKGTAAIMGHKIWLNIHALSEHQLKRFSPYLEGVVGAVETVEPVLHKQVCPSKPIKPLEKMFQLTKTVSMRRAMTIIIGLGETIDDFPLLKEFISKHDISKIHIYGLNPQKGTVFEGTPPPTADYQAEWIAKTRIAFPKIDIQLGTWSDKVSDINILLKAGANSISKFPAIRRFGTDVAKEMEIQAKKANREFLGSITNIFKINVSKMIERLEETEDMKQRISKKYEDYLVNMTKLTKK